MSSVPKKADKLNLSLFCLVLFILFSYRHTWSVCEEATWGWLPSPALQKGRATTLPNKCRLTHWPLGDVDAISKQPPFNKVEGGYTGFTLSVCKNIPHGFHEWWEFRRSNKWNWYSSGLNASILVSHTCASAFSGWVLYRQLELTLLSFPIQTCIMMWVYSY